MRCPETSHKNRWKITIKVWKGPVAKCWSLLFEDCKKCAVQSSLAKTFVERITGSWRNPPPTFFNRESPSSPKTNLESFRNLLVYLSFRTSEQNSTKWVYVAFFYTLHRIHLHWALPKHWFTVHSGFFFPIWLLMQVKLALAVSQHTRTGSQVDGEGSYGVLQEMNRLSTHK